MDRTFGEESIHLHNFKRRYAFNEDRTVSYISEVVIPCYGVFRAAKEDYELGYLFTIRGFIKAEDSTDVLEQAIDLLVGGYKDASCILAGVALEISMKEMYNQNGILIAKLDAMNTELARKSVYNLGMQKQVTTWAHWRNKAAHGEFGEYNHADVKSMIEGVQRFVADYL